MNGDLEGRFPRLAAHPYAVTSPCSDEYNCLAWAAGDSVRWWWPDPMGTGYWPDEAPRLVTLDAFARAFATLGFEPCADPQLEPGFEKIAVYVEASGVPTHAARQYRDGTWSSKLGNLEDISHATLDSLRESDYGEPAFFMKRRRDH